VLAVLLLTLTRLFFDMDHWVLWAGAAFLGYLQIMAVVLNLLPIPGLDGYDALEPHLSPETQRAVAPFKQYGVFILLFLFLAPGLNQWLRAGVDWLFGLSDVSPVLAHYGNALTRFWNRWI
jgi:Zn-dependent protease